MHGCEHVAHVWESSAGLVCSGKCVWPQWCVSECKWVSMYCIVCVYTSPVYVNEAAVWQGDLFGNGGVYVSVSSPGRL